MSLFILSAIILLASLVIYIRTVRWSKREKVERAKWRTSVVSIPKKDVLIEKVYRRKRILKEYLYRRGNLVDVKDVEAHFFGGDLLKSGLLTINIIGTDDEDVVEMEMSLRCIREQNQPF